MLSKYILAFFNRLLQHKKNLEPLKRPEMKKEYLKPKSVSSQVIQNILSADLRHKINCLSMYLF